MENGENASNQHFSISHNVYKEPSFTRMSKLGLFGKGFSDTMNFDKSTILSSCKKVNNRNKHESILENGRNIQ